MLTPSRGGTAPPAEPASDSSHAQLEGRAHGARHRLLHRACAASAGLQKPDRAVPAPAPPATNQEHHQQSSEQSFHSPPCREHVQMSPSLLLQKACSSARGRNLLEHGRPPLWACRAMNNARTSLSPAALARRNQQLGTTRKLFTLTARDFANDSAPERLYHRQPRRGAGQSRVPGAPCLGGQPGPAPRGCAGQAAAPRHRAAPLRVGTASCGLPISAGRALP